MAARLRAGKTAATRRDRLAVVAKWVRWLALTAPQAGLWQVTAHVGYDKHDSEGRNSGNSRNGTRAKTVLTDVGPVEAKVPRDVAGAFEGRLTPSNN